MKECEKCGDKVSMPYNCNRCGKDFCSDHRLPEKHNCSMLDRGSTPNDVVIEKESTANEHLSRINKKVHSYIPSTMTNTFLLIMVIVYVLQLLIINIFSDSIHNAIFVLNLSNIEYIWTWITSIFAHSTNGIFHIIGNGIIIFFFGRLLERQIGKEKFAKYFILSGVVAGISQIILGSLMYDASGGVLGASGSALYILGALTVYRPDMKVYLYFMIPVPLWGITVLYSLYSVVGASSAIGVGIAHIAHLTGLLIGIVFGYITRNNYNLTQKHNIK